MDKEYWENQRIIIHWWNGGTKELDYKGTYKGFLEKKGITVRNITRRGHKGWHFTIPLAFCDATYNDFSPDYFRGADAAIKIYLCLLGDKSILETPFFKYYLNWRP